MAGTAGVATKDQLANGLRKRGVREFLERIGGSSMKTLKTAVFAMVFSLCVATAGAAPVKNIVLVHGAFADGSSWSRVIPLSRHSGSIQRAYRNPAVACSEATSK